ncbi:MAG: hypothetical protein GKR97_14135 [Rhizobiaceae bacterium]|nr:hypothetical protein [Rhizobiaceae bacterium]
MPDRFGPRGVIAVAVPQQNSNMQPEYEAMRPQGINNQMYRFDISDHIKVPEAVLTTLPQVRGCWPDMVICSNSLEMRWWSTERQALYRKQIRDVLPDLPFVTATDACVAALKTVGAKRIGVISPMSEEMSESARAYYQAHGFEVPNATWLKVATSDRIIDIPVDAINAAFDRVDTDDIDTFLHVGGALGIVDMLDDLEARLGRPVVSSNAATYWYALRMMGIEDEMDRGGQLTRMPLAGHLREP